MSLLHMTTITARDLPDAWFQCLEHTLSVGNVWTVEHGSYQGQRRKELSYATIHVKYPGSRPLLPDTPPPIPPPASYAYLMDYLEYLLTDSPPKLNEAYTYGSRIALQVEKIIQRYRTHGYGSNQEAIVVALPGDLELDDPPCLRHIDTRIWPLVTTKAGFGYTQPALHLFPYFRSWDLWGGFPVNLAGLRYLQEFIAECIGVEAGEIIAASKGLHLYEHAWDFARAAIADCAFPPISLKL